MPLEQIQRAVETILTETLGFEPARDDTDLIESGLLDSLGFVTLLVELQQTLGIDVEIENLEVDHLRSSSGLAAYIAEQSRPRLDAALG